MMITSMEKEKLAETGQFRSRQRTADVTDPGFPEYVVCRFSGSSESRIDLSWKHAFALAATCPVAAVNSSRSQNASEQQAKETAPASPKPGICLAATCAKASDAMGTLIRSNTVGNAGSASVE